MTSAFSLLGAQKSIKTVVKLEIEHLTFHEVTSSVQNTSFLALFLSFKTVVITTTASVPKLCTGIGLFVVIPADNIVPAVSLFQIEVTARINNWGL